MPIHNNKFYDELGLMTPRECFYRGDYGLEPDAVHLRLRFEKEREQDIQGLLGKFAFDNDKEMSYDEAKEIIMALEADIIEAWKEEGYGKS